MSAMWPVRFGSYSSRSTMPVMPSLSRLKSTRRYFWRVPPPWWRVVMRPTLLRPPVLLWCAVSARRGPPLYRCERSTLTIARVPGVRGLYLIRAMSVPVRSSRGLRNRSSDRMRGSRRLSSSPACGRWYGRSGAPCRARSPPGRRQPSHRTSIRRPCGYRSCWHHAARGRCTGCGSAWRARSSRSRAGRSTRSSAAHGSLQPLLDQLHRTDGHQHLVIGRERQWIQGRYFDDLDVRQVACSEYELLILRLHHDQHGGKRPGLQLVGEQLGLRCLQRNAVGHQQPLGARELREHGAERTAVHLAIHLLRKIAWLCGEGLAAADPDG